MPERGVLEAEVKRLRELLREYGRHQEGCSAQFGDNYRCRCGWREESKSLSDLKPMPTPRTPRKEVSLL